MLGCLTSPEVPLGNRHLDSSSVDESVDDPRQVTRTEIISNEVKSLRVVLDFGVEAGEVESVEDVVLFYFAKVFVSLG